MNPEECQKTVWLRSQEEGREQSEVCADCGGLVTGRMRATLNKSTDMCCWCCCFSVKEKRECFEMVAMDGDGKSSSRAWKMAT